VYGGPPAEWKGTDEDLAKWIMEQENAQEEFYENIFLPYLKDQANNDSEFLSKCVLVAVQERPL